MPSNPKCDEFRRRIKLHPVVLVLASPNQSRLAHFRKLFALRSEYHIVGACLGKGIGWEHLFVSKWIELPSTDDLDELVKAIETATPNLDGVINLSEAYVPLHGAVCSYFGLIGPSEAVVNIGRDKFLMREFLYRLNLPIPRYSLVTKDITASLESLTFPVVLKPSIGCSSSLVERFDSRESLESRFDEIQATGQKYYQYELLTRKTVARYGEFPFLVEELMGGEVLYETCFPYGVGEFSVESIFDGTTCHILAIHDSPIAVNGPFYEKVMNSTPTRIPVEMAVDAANYVEAIHRALGRGAYVLHTEMRTMRDGLMVVEFGVRLGGSSLYSSVLHSTGNDFIQLLIQLALNERLELSRLPPTPTIIHYLCAPHEGVITKIVGETKLQSFPHYLEHQLYDDVGSKVARPPHSTRACGYVAVRGECFDTLEQEVRSMLESFRIDIEPIT